MAAEWEAPFGWLRASATRPGRRRQRGPAPSRRDRQAAAQHDSGSAATASHPPPLPAAAPLTESSSAIEAQISPRWAAVEELKTPSRSRASQAQRRGTCQDSEATSKQTCRSRTCAQGIGADAPAPRPAAPPPGRKLKPAYSTRSYCPRRCRSSRSTLPRCRTPTAPLHRPGNK